MTAEQERFLTDEQLKSSDSEFKNMQKAWYEKTYGVQTQEATTEANKRIAELEANNHDLHEALKLFKKEAESYGEAWARCYVADFDRIAADSKKVRFDLLVIQQDRLKSFADALLPTTPAESLQDHDDTKRLNWVQLHVDSALTRHQIDIAIIAMDKQIEEDRSCEHDIGN